MGQTHSIDMGGLHQSQVLQHQLLRHYTSLVWVVLMTVHTTNFDRCSVDEQLTTTDVDLTEAYLQ